MKKVVYTFMTILIMTAIFCFSAQPADESTEVSLGVGMRIGKLVNRDFNEWDYDKQVRFAEKIDHPVRKCAHATEYMILAISMFMTLQQWSKTNKKYIVSLIAWGGTVFYAITDEFHQLFVPGRSCQFTDVMIDSAGALLGCVITVVVSSLLTHKRSKE